MDGGALTAKAGSGGKAVLPVPAGINAGAATSSARVARKATLPGVAAGAADAPAAATVARGGESNGGGGEVEDDDDDDEQVERFYALLDNIQAMRGTYGSGSGDGTGALDDGVDDTGGGGARMKRLRGSEPPWRPAFRLEDFEEPTPTSSSDVAPCAKRTRGQEAEAEADGEGSGGARLDVAAVVRVRLDSGRKIV
jgi:hypothetical protein